MPGASSAAVSQLCPTSVRTESSAALPAWRDRHAGETIVVCGCGRSVRDLPNPRRWITIGVNDVGRLFDPTYLVVLNPKSQFSGDRFRYVAESGAEALFTQLDARQLAVAHPNIVRFRLGRRGGTDLTAPDALPYTRNSPYVAVCLAAFMGARQIGLIGVDFTDHHFFADTGCHPLTRELAAIDREYGALANACAARGISLVNLSVTSRLTSLRKVPPHEFAGVDATAALATAGSIRAVAPAPSTRRMFVVNYTFQACGNVFTEGLRRAAADLGIAAADADWDDPGLPRKVEAFDPDLLLIVHGRRFARRWGQTFAHRRSAVWLLDEPYEVDDSSRYSQSFRYVFVNDPATLTRHTGAHYLPVCYDPHLHYPHAGTRPYNVGFIGGANPRREELLTMLAERGRLDYVVGGPWRSPALRAICLAGKMPPERAAELYRATRIVVNVFRSVHHFNRDRIAAVALNPRVYEALACGALVVSERRAELADLVPEMPAFDTDAELATLVDRFLDRPDECASIQAACAARLRSATYSRRLLTIMNVTESDGAPQSTSSAVPDASPQPAPPETPAVGGALLEAAPDASTSEVPWKGWCVCDPVRWAAEEDVITLEKPWDGAPGSERGFATTVAATTVDLGFDVWLAPESCFLAKIHQGSPTNQLTNSYHLYSDDRVTYLARHDHMFTTLPMPRSAWTPVRLSCADGTVAIEVGGRPALRFRDRMLASGYAFVGVKGGRARLRRLRIRQTPPLPVPPSERPRYEVLRRPAIARRPLVSIITTVYDRLECLRRCIRSVKRLHFENFEQIVVADAPPPDVVDAIARVAAEEDHGRLHVLNLAQRYNNWGITPAAVGLRQATGTFVCFLSDDNGFTPDHLTNLLEVLQRDPGLGFVYSSCAYAGRLVLRHPVPCGGRIDLGQPLFRRELFSRYLDDDLPFDQLAWDWELIETFMKRGVRWRHVDKVTFIFRLAQYPALIPQ